MDLRGTILALVFPRHALIHRFNELDQSMRSVVAELTHIRREVQNLEQVLDRENCWRELEQLEILLEDLHETVAETAFRCLVRVEERNT